MHAVGLAYPTTLPHVTFALVHSISRHVMLPSAPLAKHVLTSGVLEAVIDHTSVPFHEFRINWAEDTGVRPYS